MKVGDLVRIRSTVFFTPSAQTSAVLGLIMEVARHPQVNSVARYKIWWTAQNKTGWWDAHRLEKVE